MVKCDGIYRLIQPEGVSIKGLRCRLVVPVRLTIPRH